MGPPQPVHRPWPCRARSLWGAPSTPGNEHPLRRTAFGGGGVDRASGRREGGNRPVLTLPSPLAHTCHQRKGSFLRPRSSARHSRRMSLSWRQGPVRSPKRHSCRYWRSANYLQRVQFRRDTDHLELRCGSPRPGCESKVNGIRRQPIRRGRQLIPPKPPPSRRHHAPSPATVNWSASAPCRRCRRWRWRSSRRRRPPSPSRSRCTTPPNLPSSASTSPACRRNRSPDP